MLIGAYNPMLCPIPAIRHKNWRRDFYFEAFNWSKPIREFLGTACPALETQIISVDSSVAIENYLDD